MPTNKRDSDQEILSEKRVKVASLRTSILSESLHNSSLENSFSSPGRVSLSNRNKRKSLNLLNKYDKEKNLFRREPPKKPIDSNEFNFTLNSIREINSNSFDPNRAFSYNFINNIDSYVTGETDFKTIALLLDAGTKVYVSRVNFLYNNTHKISSSLNMAIEDQKDDMEDFLDDDMVPSVEKKKRKKTKKNINTIVTNIESLNGKPETNIEIDPLFHHLSAAFDVGNVNSLLMANLKVDQNEVMLLNSGVSLDFDSSQIDPFSKFNLEEFSVNNAFEDDYICKQYRNFEFLRREVEVGLAELTAPNVDTSFDLSFDLNGDIDEVNEPVEFNFDDHFDNGPTSDCDNSIDGDNKDNRNDITTEELTDRDLNQILQFLPNSNESNQFFNEVFLRRVFKNVPRYRDLKSKKTTTAKKVKPAVLENVYSLDTDESCFKQGENIYFSSAVINKWIEQSKERRLENDTGFSFIQIRNCFTRDSDFVGLITKPKNTSQAAENSDCGDDFGEDGRHDFDASMDFNAPFEFDLETNTGKVDDDDPVHIDALDIDYAKVSKKIDIKKVKTGMWDIIQKESTEVVRFVYRKLISQLFCF